MRHVSRVSWKRLCRYLTVRSIQRATRAFSISIRLKVLLNRRECYIIRDHDREKFELKKKHMLAVCDFVNERYGKKIVECKISDSYYNMREMVEPHYEIIERLRRAMENSGVTPEIIPIRGGTDGARLSFMGLPCPNICTGGENFHGKFEFIPVQKLYKVSDILLELLTNEELYK